MDKSFSIKDIFKDKWLIIAIIIGVIIRMTYIAGPVKSDEASTFLGYIESPNILRLFFGTTRLIIISSIAFLQKFFTQYLVLVYLFLD